MRRRPVVVLGLLWAGLAAARRLGRAGLEVTGIAFTRHDFGLRSRYLAHRLVEADPERVLTAIRHVARGGRVVLFPERDAHVEFVLRHWDVLAEIADLPFPDDPAIVRRLRRKELLAGVAQEAGVATPPTAPASDEDSVRALPFRPPLLVKPVEGQEFATHFGRKLFLASSVDEAVAAWRRAHAAGFETIVQELVPDAQQRIYSLFAYVGREGEPLSTVVGRKVRAGPPHFGTASVFALCDQPRVAEVGLRLLSSAGYRGFAQVELAHDVRDDVLKLLEVNTRPPQWAGVAMTDEHDVALLAYDDLAGASPRPLRPYVDPAVVWIYGAKDAWSALQMLRAREAGPRAVLAPYLARKKVRAIVSADDPLPALASLAYLRSKVA